MSRLFAIVGIALVCGACARQAATAPSPPDDSVARLRQDNLALRRRVQMLEDRVLRLERRGPSHAAGLDDEANGRDLPVVRLERKEAAKAPPAVAGSRPDPRRSKPLGSRRPTAPTQPWDTVEDGEDGAGDVADAPDPGEAAEPSRPGTESRSFRLVGTELVQATRAKAPKRPDRPARDARGKTIIAEYETAMALYKAGELGGAERAFGLFARAHPKHDYADNAIYWRGESAYDQGHYSDALAAFTEVIERYGGGNKAADALLKIGLCYGKLGDRDNARDVLSQLVTAYPDADASRIASDRLAEWESG